MSTGTGHVLKTMGKSLDPKVTGKNGSEIKGLAYHELAPHARQVVNMIRRGPNERFWDPGRDNVTVFGNKMGDLPDGGSYKEFTVLATEAGYTSTYGQLAATVVPPMGTQGRKPLAATQKKGQDGVDKGFAHQGAFASGAERIVYDSAGKHFYYTPTHYDGHLDETGSMPVYYNPFFLITDMDAESHLRQGPGF